MSVSISELSEGLELGLKGDDQLSMSTDIRNLLVKDIIDSNAFRDPKLANVLLAALKANDTIVLAEKRNAVDTEIGGNNAQAIIEAAKLLKETQGNNLIPPGDMGTPRRRDVPLDGSQFTFTPGESIVGLDTENASNGSIKADSDKAS